MYQKTILIGNTGKAPEIRNTNNGKKVANVGLAVKTGYGNNAKTEWFNLVLWEKKAEIAEKYIGKGQLISVEGTLQSRDYEGKKYWDLVVDNLTLFPKSQSNKGDELTQEDDESPF